MNKNLKMSIKNAKENFNNMKLVLKYWELGPIKASTDPKANKDYWTKLAKSWNVTEQEARRMLCANCEYFNNTPNMMAQMDKIPYDSFDKDAGGRGYCHKFNFICHNLRTCKAWEEKEFELED